MTLRARPLPGYRLVDTRQGDTLQRIALRELGDAARWPQLAELNNLLPPYVVETLADLEDTPSAGVEGGRVLLAGQPIKVPAPGPAAPAGVLSATDIFGTDLALPDGLLRATPAGDLLLVSGVPNLSQALEHRLETPMGELLYHPGYGQRFHELRGGPQNQLTNMLAAGYAESAIRSDPRVDRTEGIRSELAGDAKSITGTAIATNGKRLPVGGD